MVWHQLPKLRVAGLSPVFRSKITFKFLSNAKNRCYIDFFHILANTNHMKKFMVITLLIFSILLLPTRGTYVCYAENDCREVPIIMYHSILKSKKGAYTVSPDEFKSDLLELKKLGYESVFIQDVINYCNGTGSLPEKPVVISFDDGHYNNYAYAYPILKEVGFKANLNVIGSFCEFSTSSGDCDNPNYSYLTWDEIKELKESGVFEIGNHTYAMHKYKPRFGIGKLPNEDAETYKNSLTADVLKLEDKFYSQCGFKTNIFAYPFGKYEKESGSILSQLGFEAFLTCNEGINKLTKGDTSQLSHLKRINRNGTLTSQQFFKNNKLVRATNK